MLTSVPFAILYPDQETTSGYPTAPVPTTARPEGDGIAPVVDGAAALLYFYGTRTEEGDTNEEFVARVTGWRASGGTSWIPMPLLVLRLTLGATVGLANATPSADDAVVDKIEVEIDYTDASYELSSPDDDTAGYIKIDAFGCTLFQVQLGLDTAASAGCLLSIY